GQPRCHLVPNASQCVVSKECDNVAWGEELVADRKLSAGARSRGFVPHLLSFGWVVVVLVHPPNRLVFCPQRFHIMGINQGQALQERRFPRKQDTLRRTTVEQDTEID